MIVCCECEGGDCCCFVFFVLARVAYRAEIWASVGLGVEACCDDDVAAADDDDDDASAA